MFETVACQENTKDIIIENCKRIVSIVPSGFDRGQSHPRQESVQRIVASGLQCKKLGWAN